MLTTYRASVAASRFLSKVDRVFDAAPITVFNELIQNARRAQATVICISLQPQSDGKAVAVFFSDNGGGIDSPQPLLQLAGSSWKDEIETSEDPAGMGFFCLSNFEAVRVRSRRWTAVFSPPVFRGDQLLEADDSEPVVGMTIAWSWPAVELWTLDAAATAAAEYCGVEVRMDTDGKIKRMEPKGFLDGGVARRSVAELGVELAALPDQYSRGSDRPEIRLNFHGVTLKIDRDEHLSMIGGLGITLRANVLKTAELQLVLPARNALKHNAGRERLLRECERLCYEWIRDTKFAHRLPYVAHRRALDVFGVDIGPAVNNLSYVTNRWWDDNSIGMERVIVDMRVSLEVGFCDLFDLAADGHVVGVQEDSAMEGYAWYDSMRRVDSMSVIIDGAAVNLDDFYSPRAAPTAPEGEASLFAWADSIRVEFRLSDTSLLICEPVAVVSGEGNESYFPNAEADFKVYVRRSVRDSPAQRAAVLDVWFDAVFEASDSIDCETSSYDQARDFRAASTEAFLKFVGDEQGAALVCVESAIEAGGLEYATARDWTWSIHSVGKGETSTTMIVGPHRDPGACRKLVTQHAANTDEETIYELVSLTPLTWDRIVAYMTAQHLYNPERGDSLCVRDWVPPVDIDAWETSRDKTQPPA